MAQDRRSAIVNGIDPPLRFRNHTFHGTMLVDLRDRLAEVHARVGLGSLVLRVHYPSPSELFLYRVEGAYQARVPPGILRQLGRVVRLL